MPHSSNSSSSTDGARRRIFEISAYSKRKSLSQEERAFIVFFSKSAVLSTEPDYVEINLK